MPSLPFHISSTKHITYNITFTISSTDIVVKSPSRISKITSATSKNEIFLFIFFSRYGILILEKYPLRGLPFAGQLCIYFFFLGFLDFLCFISCRAVKVKTKISIKSFIISNMSCIVSTPLFSPFQCFALIFSLSSFLCFNYIPFSVYCQRLIYRIFKKIRGYAARRRYTLNAFTLTLCSSQDLSSLRRFSAYPSLPYFLFLPLPL